MNVLSSSVLFYCNFDLNSKVSQFLRSISLLYVLPIPWAHSFGYFLLFIPRAFSTLGTFHRHNPMVLPYSAMVLPFCQSIGAHPIVPFLGAIPLTYPLDTYLDTMWKLFTSQDIKIRKESQRFKFIIILAISDLRYQSFKMRYHVSL